ncbi:MAG: helix-hairpin-helix domain-containing protein [Bacteroidales bacterium]|nr:helix-hairpin-helix domain-containing protein [Bacteroidales bacterium]
MTESVKRGYLWATLLLAVLLLAVLLWPSPKTEIVDHEADSVSAEPGAEMVYGSPRTYHNHRHYQKNRQPHQQPDWNTLYEGGREYRSKYDDFVVELNAADTADLKELRGIGSSFARRIIKYRNLLGGYQSREQLKEVYGMTDTLYSLIAPHIRVDAQQCEKIHLNTVSLDSLKRHPYLDYYQAKSIIRRRDADGDYTSVEQLQELPLIDQETYNKIKNYLTL